jgi:hypothetical protein
VDTVTDNNKGDDEDDDDDRNASVSINNDVHEGGDDNENANEINKVKNDDR